MRALVFYVFLVGCLCIPLCRTKTVRNVSARTVTKNKDIAKRATNLEENANSNNEFFPNWVPFANKNIEELGELVAVKSKPKKRLAPPMNYVLKPVADTNSEDYYDKPHEGDDGPYKLELPAIESSPNNNTLDTEEPLTTTTTTTTTSTTTTEKTTTFKTTSEPTAVEPSTPKVTKRRLRKKVNEASKKKKEKRTYDEEFDVKEQVKSRNNEKKLKEKEKEKVIKKDYDADYDDEEGASKARNETQITTNEKHIPQLDEVDELKRRHEAEQRQLAEEAREEEYKIEERERDLQLFNDRRKENDFRGWGDKRADYDETDVEKTTKKPRRKVNSNGEAPRKLYSTRISPKSSNYVQERTNDNSIRKSSTDEPPRSDSDYVENDEKLYNYGKKSTLRSKQKNDNRRNKQRSSYDVTSRAPLTTGGQYELYNERIKVTPELTKEESKNNPNKINKTRKTKRRRKPKTTTDAPDSFVAESIEDTASTKATITTAAAIAPSADAVSTNTDVVVDAVSAASDHKKDGGGDHSYKRGGGKEHFSEEKSEHAEHGKKAYEGKHEEHKKTVGHHDKEKHNGHYDDSGGHDRHHHDESEHYGGHHHEEHGKKNAKYEESGRHSKGHNTKGSHDIHKKEEYEKKVEFFEEEGDSDDEEKHGGFNDEKEHASGGHFKKGNLEASHKGGEKGHSGHHVKGGHALGFKEHRKSGGHDAHGKHDVDGHVKGGHASGKKWVYHHGHPAKTANLVAVDRRSGRGPVHFLPQY